LYTGITPAVVQTIKLEEVFGAGLNRYQFLKPLVLTSSINLAQSSQCFEFPSNQALSFQKNIPFDQSLHSNKS